MKLRFIFSLIIFFLFCQLSFGQCVVNCTTVTATVTDSTGQAWTNGSWRADLLPPYNNPAPLRTNNAQIPGNLMSVTGTMDGTGFFTVNLTSNNLISPSGTVWKFTICSNTSDRCYNSYQVLSGASQNLSASISADSIPPSVTATQSITRAYKDSEVNAAIGGVYWDVSLNVLKGCTNLTCPGFGFSVIGPGGGGGGGVTFKVNGTNLSSQTLVNFQNSSTIDGVTYTFSDQGGGTIQIGRTGTLLPTGGGTGLGSGTTNGILYFSGATTIASTVAGGAGTVCFQETNGGAPFWGGCSAGSISGTGTNGNAAGFTGASSIGNINAITFNNAASPDVIVTQITNGDTAFRIKRNTDTIPSGNAFEVTNAAASVLCAIDVTGALGSCNVPAGLLSGTVAQGRLPATIVYNNQANTYTGGGLQDFTAMVLKIPNSGGNSPPASAEIGYDTTANKFVGNANGIVAGFVFDSRTISTTSPLVGGGDFTANRIFACPTCVTSVSGTTNQITSTGGTNPVLAIANPFTFPGSDTLGGNENINNFALVNGYTNDAAGTSTGLLVTFTSGATVKTMSAGGSGYFGVCVSGCSTSGTALIAQFGIASVVADNTVTTGDYIIPGSTTAGRAKSNGTTYPVSGDFVGVALGSTTAGSSFNILLHPPENKTSSAGSVTFDQIGTGTNTTATMTVGSGGTLTYSGTGFIAANNALANVGIKYAEGTAPTFSASNDFIYGDSTAHRLKMSNNNGTADVIVGANTIDTFNNKSMYGSVANVDTLLAKVDTQPATTGTGAFINCGAQLSIPSNSVPPGRCFNLYTAFNHSGGTASVSYKWIIGNSASVAISGTTTNEFIGAARVCLDASSQTNSNIYIDSFRTGATSNGSIAKIRDTTTNYNGVVAVDIQFNVANTDTCTLDQLWAVLAQ